MVYSNWPDCADQRQSRVTSLAKERSGDFQRCVAPKQKMHKIQTRCSNKKVAVRCTLIEHLCFGPIDVTRLWRWSVQSSLVQNSISFAVKETYLRVVYKVSKFQSSRVHTALKPTREPWNPGTLEPYKSLIE